MTEVQEKKHMDPTNLSSRTPFGQLMWRAFKYMHQVGADGSTTPLPSIKKILVIFGSPLVCMGLPDILQHPPCTGAHVHRDFSLSLSLCNQAQDVILERKHLAYVTCLPGFHQALNLY